MSLRIDFVDEDAGIDIDKEITNPDEYHRLLMDLLQHCATRIVADEILNDVMSRRVTELNAEVDALDTALIEAEKQSIKMEKAILESLHKAPAFGSGRDKLCNCPTCRNLRASLEPDDDDETNDMDMTFPLIT